MPKIDIEAVPQTNRTGYPAPHDAAVAGASIAGLRPRAG